MPRIVRETFPVGLLACNCTLLADLDAGTAIVIDPGLDGPTGKGSAYLLARLQAVGVRLTQIIITHAHIDHVGGALALKQATGAPIWMHQADLPLLTMMEEQAEWLGGIAPPPVAPPDASAEDGVRLGLETFPAEVLHTPGHTPGSICLWFAPLPEASAHGLLIAGDTLFAGSIGRTDLPLGDDRLILRSIQARLLPLPEATHVVPGHGGETTIGRERERNPFLRHLR
jgi:glyoxylase-like metal-dependent hydrolase (beta-lactamase superfamily II)